MANYSEDRYFFGLSTVILSDRLIISEPKADTEIEKWAGKVHLYDKSGNLIQTKVSPDPKTTGNFGFRVVADEDIIVVSELVGNIEMQEFKTGSVYVFDNEFGLQATLSPPNPDELNYFGYSLGLSDDFIFVGDRQATAGGQERAGVIYVYDRVGELQFTIESRNPSTGSYFGESMAVEEDILVVGEPYFDHETVDTGKIYVYKKTGGDYILEDEIVPSEPTAKGWFGKTVSLSDGKIIVGETGTENVFVYSLGEPPKAELIFANLEVPDEVLKGETATITVDCTNIGTVTGSTSVCLNIDGVMIENKTVTVDAGKTEPVNFTYSPDEVGTHKVEIEGLVSEYEVKDVPPVPPVPGYPVNAVVSGLLVTAYLVYYLSRNQ